MKRGLLGAEGGTQKIILIWFPGDREIYLSVRTPLLWRRCCLRLRVAVFFKRRLPHVRLVWTPPLPLCGECGKVVNWDHDRLVCKG